MGLHEQVKRETREGEEMKRVAEEMKRVAEEEERARTTVFPLSEREREIVERLNKQAPGE